MVSTHALSPSSMLTQCVVLSAYALGCAVLTFGAFDLRACKAIRGTDTAYGAPGHAEVCHRMDH
eukprot:1600865-Rhodomonas_salina.1